jgi:transposase
MKHYLGIDLSKEYFDVTLLKASGEQVHAQFENRPAGHSQLWKWLKEHGTRQAAVCMEATNTYWEAVTEYLYTKGYSVSVVNPARIKGYAMSQLRRSKTDKLDSAVIADFCRSCALKGGEAVLRTWTPPTPEQRQLRNLVRQRSTLVETLTQQKNRLGDCQDETGQACWQRLISLLKAEIAQVDKALAQHIGQHPDLKKNCDLLCSIKGFGLISAATLLAEMPDLEHYKDAAAVAADAGVTPAHYESGDTVRRKPRISRIGKAAIRGLLYMPAITAMRSNPLLQRFAERLRQKGKPNKLIIVAVIRKLLHLAYGVLKHQKPFDPHYGAAPLPVS